MLIQTENKVAVIEGLVGDVSEYVEKSPIETHRVITDTSSDNLPYLEIEFDNTNSDNAEVLSAYLGCSESIIVEDNWSNMDTLYLEGDALTDLLSKIYEVNAITLLSDSDSHYLIYKDEVSHS